MSSSAPCAPSNRMLPPSLAHVVKDRGDVVDHRTQVLAPGERFVEDGLVIDRLGLQPLGQHEVVVLDGGLHLLRQLVRVHEVSHADRTAGDLVLVRRADAATGRADGLRARRHFARLIDGDVVRHDQRRGRRDLQARTHVHALLFQLGDFAHQRGGRQHHAVADQAERVIAQDARRDEVQDGLLALDDQRMARVVATLETRDGADTFGEEIDDLALALVAPLRAENDD